MIGFQCKVCRSFVVKILGKPQFGSPEQSWYTGKSRCSALFVGTPAFSGSPDSAQGFATFKVSTGQVAQW